MAIIELHPRRKTLVLDGEPTAERLFLATPHATGSSVAIPALGSPHPDNGSLKALQISEETRYDGDPEQTLTTVTYGVNAAPCESDPNPLARCDRWTVSTGLTSVPVYRFFDGTSFQPLVNSAGDYLPGHQGQQPEAHLTLHANRAQFPMDYLVTTNKINDAAWKTANPRAWLCAGMRAEKKSELVGTQVISYYEVAVDFIYNDSLWQLYVPDVGLYYLDGGVKRRCYVEDHNGNYVPASSPVPLNPDGSMKTSGDPNILTRRIYQEADFTAIFGNSPF